MPHVPPDSFCGACGGRLDLTRPRPVCTTCGRIRYQDPKVGVGVVVRDEAGRLLLVRRGVGPGKGAWALPAGFVDAGEDPRGAAARETLEETGLVVEVGAVLEVYPGPAVTGGHGASLFVAFEATVTGGDLAAADDATDAAFFAPDNLPALAFDSTTDAAQRSASPLAQRAAPLP